MHGSQGYTLLFSFRSFKAASRALGTPWSGSCRMETNTSIVTSMSFWEREKAGFFAELLDCFVESRGLDTVLGMVFLSMSLANGGGSTAGGLDPSSDRGVPTNKCTGEDWGLVTYLPLHLAPPHHYHIQPQLQLMQRQPFQPSYRDREEERR